VTIQAQSGESQSLGVPKRALRQAAFAVMLPCVLAQSRYSSSQRALVDPLAQVPGVSVSVKVNVL